MSSYLPKTKRANTAMTVMCAASIASSAYVGWHNNAVSSEGTFIKRAATNIHENIEKSQALFGSKIDAVNLLKSIANSHLEDNWDGDDAKAVHPDSFIVAELFIKALPADLLMPELDVDTNGCVLFDWTTSKSKTLTLSVGPNGVIAYAWINNSNRGRAVFAFVGTVPNEIVESIKAVTNYGFA
ncbi:MAG TPA: hypothetical protein VGO57_18475 [Verrucomicrobiae bacterium]|jgi:hypothetical protein